MVHKDLFLNFGTLFIRVWPRFHYSSVPFFGTHYKTNIPYLSAICESMKYYGNIMRALAYWLTARPEWAEKKQGMAGQGPSPLQQYPLATTPPP